MSEASCTGRKICCVKDGEEEEGKGRQVMSMAVQSVLLKRDRFLQPLLSLLSEIPS